MTAALEGCEWSAAHPSRTLPPGKTRYPLNRRLGEPQGRSGRAENLVLTGIRSRTVQTVAQSLYRLSYPALFKGYLGCFSGIKRPWGEVDHSLLMPILRISGAVLLPPLYAFMTCTFTFFSKKYGISRPQRWLLHTLQYYMAQTKFGTMPFVFSITLH